MSRNIYTIILLVLGSFSPSFAGNPDRQGESGAYELLINPWARSGGLHSINTSSVMGIEAMQINIAGLSRLLNSEIGLANTQLFKGSTLTMSSFGYGTKIGKSGTLGVCITSLSFGDIPITTVNLPEGVGGNFSPNFFNLGLGYSHMYENRISVGLLVRAISESIADVSAFGFAIDAGVQYVSGENDNFRLGISLRNTGSPMKFGGQGLSFQAANPDIQTPGVEYPQTYDERAEDFELPSMLNIGTSYDFYWNTTKKEYVRAMVNFTSNAFSRDQLGIGAEFVFRDIFILRGAYKKDVGGTVANFEDDVYTGLSAGATFSFPMKRGSDTRLGLDYGFRATSPFNGTHSLSLRLSL